MDQKDIGEVEVKINCSEIFNFYRDSRRGHVKILKRLSLSLSAEL